MKAKIFESLDALNAYLADKKKGVIRIQFSADVVGTRKQGDETIYELVERFLVIEK